MSRKTSAVLSPESRAELRDSANAVSDATSSLSSSSPSIIQDQNAKDRTSYLTSSSQNQEIDLSFSSCLFTAGLGFWLTILLCPKLKWWSVFSFLPELTPKRVIFLGAVSVFASLVLAFRNRRLPTLSPTGAVPALLLISMTNWLDTEYSLLMGPLIRGELIVAAILGAMVLRYSLTQIYAWILPFTIGAMFINFILLARGRLIFSDDHPVFLFRFAELKDNFPRIPIFDVMWNSGLDSMYFFASGILNVYFLLYPLIEFFDLKNTYSYIPLIVCAGFTPLALYLSARLFNFDTKTSLIAAAFSVCANLFWYRWCLKYGTLGFAVSSLLVPLTSGFFYRAYTTPKAFNFWFSLAFVISTSFCIFWPLMVFALIPVGVIFLLNFKRWLGQKSISISLFLIASLNLPWMILFWGDYALPKALAPQKQIQQGQSADFGNSLSEEVSEVASDPSAESPESLPVTTDLSSSNTKTHGVIQKHRDKSISLHNTLFSLRDHRAAANPVLLLMTIPGILLLDRRRKRYLGALFGWLLLLGAVFSPKIPQLELDRMILVLCLFASIPAAHALSELWNARHRNILASICAVIALAFSITALRCPIEAMGSKRVENFSFASKLVYSMADAIKKHAGSGRVLFSGFVLHDLDKGHLAPLTTLTGVPLMASSHVHNLWAYKSVFPTWVEEGGDSELEKFLDFNAVSAVIAHELRWKDYFKARPEKYHKVWEGGRFMLFTRLELSGDRASTKQIVPTFFLSGSGEIYKQDTSGVRLRVDSESAVIKFNYNPGLEVVADKAPIEEGLKDETTTQNKNLNQQLETTCQIKPKPASAESVFIELSNCTPGDRVHVRSKSFFARLLTVLKGGK